MNCLIKNKKFIFNIALIVLSVSIFSFFLVPNLISINKIINKYVDKGHSVTSLPDLENLKIKTQGIIEKLPESKNFTLPLGQELTLITACEQLAKNNDLNLKLNLNSETTEISTNILKRDISLELTGDYTNIYKFINQSEKNLTSIQIKLINVLANAGKKPRAILSGQSYWFNPNL